MAVKTHEKLLIIELESQELAPLVTRCARLAQKETKAERFCLSKIHLYSHDGNLVCEAGDGVRYLSINTGILASELDICVPATLLERVMGSLDGGPVKMTIDREKERFSLGSNTQHFDNLPLSPGEDYDRLPEADDFLFQLPAQQLKVISRQLGSAADVNSQDPIKQAIHLKLIGQTLQIGATSGARLAFQSILLGEENASPVEAYLPLHAYDVRAMSDAIKGGLATVHRSSNGQVVRVSCNGANFVSRILQIPQEVAIAKVVGMSTAGATKSLLIPTSAIVEMIEAASVTGEVVVEGQRVNTVHLRASKEKQSVEILSGSAVKGGRSQSEYGFTGEAAAQVTDDIEFHSNAAYLLDGLRAVGTENVVIKALDSFKPVVIVPDITPDEENRYTYVLSPIRIKSSEDA